MSSLNVLYALIAASMVDEEGKDFFTYCEEVSDLALELKCSVASPKGSVVRRLEELDEAVPIKGVLCGISRAKARISAGSSPYTRATRTVKMALKPSALNG